MRTALVAALVLFAGTVLAEGEMSKSLQPLKGVTSLERVPANVLIMARGENGQTLMFSDGGRYLITDFKMQDTWNNGMEIKGPEDLQKFGNRLQLSNIPTHMLATAKFGTGKERLIAFVDPRCPYCHQLFEFLEKNADKYTAELVLFPALGEESEMVARRMTCELGKNTVESHATVVRALFSRNLNALGTEDKCDLTKLRNAVMTAGIMGIQGVPFIVASDGRFNPGLPQDLAAWVAAK